MPGIMSNLDTGLPRFTGTESTEDKISAIQNYLFVFLEELRYVLRNLGTENFNDASLKELTDGIAGDVEKTVGTLIADNIKADTIITNTFITNELYGKYGEIADLVVWQLRTDYEKIHKYLAHDTSDVNYQHIRGEKIDFFTDSVASPVQAVQLVRDGRAFYWKDAGMEVMTSEEITPYPVMIYKYDNLLKATIRFENLILDGGQQTWTPRITLGAGDSYGYSKGYILKQQYGLELSYTKTGTGELRKVYIGDNGVEITKPIIDSSSYGYADPNAAGIPGVEGQLYFQLEE